MTPSLPEPHTALARVAIETVRPEIDGGRFPIKRIVGDVVTVEADIIADGHDVLSCRLLWRAEGDEAWIEAPMRALGNDRWRAEFPVTALGRVHYTVEGWVDRFRTWRRSPTTRSKRSPRSTGAACGAFRRIRSSDSRAATDRATAPVV
jgi:starch synthase (maltosyl-transferring)